MPFHSCVLQTFLHVQDLLTYPANKNSNPENQVVVNKASGECEPLHSHLHKCFDLNWTLEIQTKGCRGGTWLCWVIFMSAAARGCLSVLYPSGLHAPHPPTPNNKETRGGSCSCKKYEQPFDGAWNSFMLISFNSLLYIGNDYIDV